MAEPGSRYAIVEFTAHVERVADGTLWLEAPRGSSNHVGVWLKYLWVSLSHLLGPTREAPRFDALTPPYCKVAPENRTGR